MRTITIELPESDIVAYAKEYWDESEWPNVVTIKAKIQPSVVLQLYDGNDRMLGVVQGSLDNIVFYKVQVTPAATHANNFGDQVPSNEEAML